MGGFALSLRKRSSSFARVGIGRDGFSDRTNRHRTPTFWPYERHLVEIARKAQQWTGERRHSSAKLGGATKPRHNLWIASAQWLFDGADYDSRHWL